MVDIGNRVYYDGCMTNTAYRPIENVVANLQAKLDDHLAEGRRNPDAHAWLTPRIALLEELIREFS